MVERQRMDEYERRASTRGFVIDVEAVGPADRHCCCSLRFPGAANKGSARVSSSSRTGAWLARLKRDALALAVLWSGMGAASAQLPSGAYAGKQIRMMIVAGAGGGYDAYA